MSYVNLNDGAAAVAQLVGSEAIARELKIAGIPVSGDAVHDAALLLRNVRGHGDVVAVLVNATDGHVTGDAATVVLKACFPTMRVGKRHGPHYLSLCRTGKIKGVRDGLTVAKGGRKARTEAPAEAKADAAPPADAPAPAEAPLTKEAVTAMDDAALMDLAKALGVKTRGGAALVRGRVLATIAA